MKSTLKIMVCLTAIAMFTVALSANALSLGGYTGNIVLEMANGVNSGTLYGGLSRSKNYGGTTYTNGNVDNMDVLGSAHTNNAGSSQSWLKGSNPTEDSFGVGEIKRIFGGTSTSGELLYEAGEGGNDEIFGVIYGNEDFGLVTDFDNNQTIFGSGMRIDIYENPDGTLASASDGSGTGYDQGTNARTHSAPGTPSSSGELYNGVSNGGGTLIWSLITEPGFVSSTYADATFKGDATVNNTTEGTVGSASGQMYASVGTTEGGTGSLNWMIDHDPWQVGSGTYAGNTADVWITFDADSDGTPDDWALNLNDDMKLKYTPEPAAILLAFLAAPIAGVVQVLRRRRQKKA